jgi:hypothetical protein
MRIQARKPSTSTYNEIVSGLLIAAVGVVFWIWPVV